MDARTGGNGQRANARREAPVWALLMGFGLVVATLRLATELSGMAALGVLGGIVLLGVAGLRWGADSRDGRDWRTGHLRGGGR